TGASMLLPRVCITGAGGAQATLPSQPSGIAAPGPCPASFPTSPGAPPTAAPASGSGLAGWSGDFASCGFGQTCNVQVAAMRSGAARFEKGGYVVWAVKVQATGSAGIKNVRMTVGGDLIVAGTYAGEGDVHGAPLPSAPLGVGTPYVARLSGLDGSARWVRGFPTTGLLYANVSDFVVDPGTGDIVLAGSFGGTLDLGGPQPLVSDFNGDLFVARLS